MATAQKQKLVFGILDFLQSSLKDGTVKEDDKEGLEVAMQCIGEAFDVDLTDTTHSIKPMTLMQIFSVYTQMQEKRAGSTSTPAAPAAAPAPKLPTAEDKRAAEALKTKGNQLMSAKNYSEAIAKYTAAIDLDPAQKVFYSNRAAAYSQAGDHSKAIDDAKKAAELDPSYAKAYSRLGHALFSSGRYNEAVEALEKGVELDPENASMKSSLAAARSKATPEDEEDMPELSSPAARGAGAGGMPDLASLLGGMGGSGGGGMPDLASIMSNPMVQNFAQSMMANGGMERLMQNPQMRQMAENMRNGGQMPSMSDMAGMMQDPEMQRLAAQFNGGAGRGQNSNSDMYS